VKSRGQKGKHGETDREILQLILLNLEHYPDGLTKKQIYEALEKITGKDREGIKRRITELTRSLEGVFVCRNVLGKMRYGIKVSNLYDLSKLYVTLQPELSLFDSEIEGIFAKETERYFTDFVDYLRIFWPDPIAGNKWGFPKSIADWWRDDIPAEYGSEFAERCSGEEQVDELAKYLITTKTLIPFRRPLSLETAFTNRIINNELHKAGVTADINNDKFTQTKEFFRIDEEGILIEDTEHPQVIRSSYRYHPEEFPDFGTERVKRIFRRIIEQPPSYIKEPEFDELTNKPVLPDRSNIHILKRFCKYLPLVYDFHNELSKEEELSLRFIFPGNSMQSQINFTNLYSSVLPEHVASELLEFFEFLKGLLSHFSDEETTSFAERLPITTHNPRVRLQKRDHITYWEIYRFEDVNKTNPDQAQDEGKTVDDDGLDKPNGKLHRNKKFDAWII